MRLWREICLSFAVLLTILNTANGDDPVVVITETTPGKDRVDDFMKCLKDYDAMITCAVTNKPIDSDVKWVMQALGNDNNIPISSDLASEDPFKYSLEKPTPTAWRLRVQNVQVTDEGRYTCRVQTGPQIYVSAVADIRVTELPQIADLETSSDMTVKEGDTVLLRCNATGRPFPIVSWSRVAGKLLPTGGRELQDYLLRIPSAKAEDAGSYKCSGTNFAGSVSRIISLLVKFSPDVKAKTPRVGQKPGYVKQLECNIRAYPVPTEDQITWVHSINPIYHGGRHRIKIIPGAYNSITTKLSIIGVQPSDYGIYKCSATNELGDDEASIELYATDEPTKDDSGQIVARSSVLTTSLHTIIMLLSICLLHRLHW